MLLFLAAFSFSGPVLKTAEASPTPTTVPVESGKVIVLVLDGLDVDLFASPEWTNLRRVVEGGAVGLMNSRTAPAAASAVSAAAHATVGAGVRLPGAASSGVAYDVEDTSPGQPAGQLYEALSGRTAPEEGVVVLGLASLRQGAADLGLDRFIGTVGEKLKEQGRFAAVLGNADVLDPRSGPTPRRHGALIAMDRQGVVPLGAVGPETLTYDEDWPFGVRTDYDALWSLLADVYDRADFIVVEFGDLARLDLLSEWVEAERVGQLQRWTVRRMDDWIGQFAAWPPASGAVLALVVPSPPAAAVRAGQWLTPMAWARIGAPSTGTRLATSKTTRRIGIVANTDLAESFSSAANGGPGMDSVDARRLSRDLPPTAARPQDPWDAVVALHRRAVAVHALRPSVIQTFVVSAIVLFLAGTLGYVAARLGGQPGPSPRIAPLWTTFMLLLSSAPLAMLLLPLLPWAPGPEPATALALAALTGAAALGAWAGGKALFPVERLQSGRPIGPFVLLSLTTALAIVADAWFGSRLMKSSVLGFDPIVGARYYGIGNEYMGILIGTVLVGTTGWLDLRPIRSVRGDRLLVLLMYALVCLTLAGPDLGANAGGTAAAATACGVTAAMLLRKKLSAKTVLQAAAGAALLLLAAAAFDAVRGEEIASHFGQTVHLALREGPGALTAVVGRKLAMNLKLLRWTIWAQVFVVCLGVAAAALLRPSAAVARLESRHPNLLLGIRGAAVGALVALAANDSGIVAAATAMIPVTATFMHAAYPGASKGSAADPLP